MSRKLDLLFGMLLVFFAIFLLWMTASGQLPSGGYVSKPDIDSMTTAEFLRSTSIDLNHADQEELMELYGIGEVLSQRIIDHRETVGPFSCVEDLLQVKGIGEKRLEMVRRYVYAG